jgi:type IX secretion system PorP/SprF family membrane protein
MKKIILIALFLLFEAILLHGQDVHFSQFYMAPLTQNPAMAGALNPMEARINYRNQWGNVGVPYTTYAASIDMRYKRGKAQTGFWGFGLNFYNDESGSARLNSTIANLSTTYHVTINAFNTLGVGFQTGMGQRRVNTSNFQWGSQFANNAYNAALPSGESFSAPSFMYLDLSGGLVWTFNNNSGRKKVTGNNFKQGTMGFSIFHFNRPNYSFDRTGERLYIRYAFHGNYLLSIPSTKIAINPGYMIMLQGPNTEIFFGSMIRYNLVQESKYTGAFNGGGIYLGAYLRAGDAVIISSLFELSDYAIGISYDINTSQLVAASGGRGGIELTFRYTNRNGKMGGSGF